MLRPPRVDEAGGIYHALNCVNMRATIFNNNMGLRWVSNLVIKDD